MGHRLHLVYHTTVYARIWPELQRQKKKERSALKMLLIQVGLQLRDRRKDNVFIQILKPKPDEKR